MLFTTALLKMYKKKIIYHTVVILMIYMTTWGHI